MGCGRDDMIHVDSFGKPDKPRLQRLPDSNKAISSILPELCVAYETVEEYDVYIIGL